MRVAAGTAHPCMYVRPVGTDVDCGIMEGTSACQSYSLSDGFSYYHYLQLHLHMSHTTFSELDRCMQAMHVDWGTHAPGVEGPS